MGVNPSRGGTMNGRGANQKKTKVPGDPGKPKLTKNPGEGMGCYLLQPREKRRSIQFGKKGRLSSYQIKEGGQQFTTEKKSS